LGVEDAVTERTTHTPGPWVIDEFYERGGFFKIGTAKAVLCHVHSFAESGLADPVARADANLIAAAPELLRAAGEALNALLDYVPAMERQGAVMGYGLAVIACLKDAIAKATP